MTGIPECRVSGTAQVRDWEARLELTRRRPALVLLDEILPGESSVDFLGEFVARRDSGRPDDRCRERLPIRPRGRSSDHQAGLGSLDEDRPRSRASFRLRLQRVKA